MNIFVSNLNAMTTESHLRNLFLPFGNVESSTIVRDMPRGLSSGFGYIKMNYKSALMAIHELNNMRFMNYFIEVREAGI